MKTGVSSYSFGKYINETKCDYFKVCDLAKEMGFDGIEFINLENYTERRDLLALADEIREHCEKTGLEICAYTVGADLLAEDIEAEKNKLKSNIDIAERLGAPLLRHDVCYKLPDDRFFSWERAIEKMSPHIREITEYAAAKGIRTCTENHGYIFQAPERVEALINAVGSENYGWLCDIGNFLCADADPAYSASVAAPHAFHVHVKDFIKKSGECIAPDGFFATSDGNYIRGTVVGHGVVPVKTCIDILKRKGYDGYVSLEFEGMEECLPAIRSGLAYLKKLGI